MSKLIGQYYRFRFPKWDTRENLLSLVNEVWSAIAPLLSCDRYYLRSISRYYDFQHGNIPNLIPSTDPECRYFRVPCKKKLYILRFYDSVYALVDMRDFWCELNFGGIDNQSSYTGHIVRLWND